MARLVRFLVCATLAVTALGLGTASPAVAADCGNTNLRPSRDNVDRARAATLCLLNNERARHDLAPLRDNKHLRRAAQAYSRKMVRKRFFAHVCPEGSTVASRIRRTKYLSRGVRDWSVGENLAWGSGSLSTPKSIVRGWMRSGKHRAAILNSRFRDVGIGVTRGAPASVSGRAATYTADFGYRKSGS